MKEIKGDANRWRNIPCYWIRRMDIVKMSILLKAIYRFNRIPIKISIVFFHRIRTSNFTICTETQRIRIAQVILRKKNWTGAINLPDFRLYYKVAVVKTVWYWHKDRNKDQWNKTDSPEVGPWTYEHLIFDKGAKIYNGVKTISSTSVAE